MPRIAMDKQREIVEDFAKAIRERQASGPKPSTSVIPFRTWMKDQLERPVMQVPVSLLRYRKENGRIASDVLDYEREHGPLDEKDVAAQAKLEGFLADKDPEKMKDLMDSIEHVGQSQPAIITADGFLINGNRRKMVLEKLRKKRPGVTDFDFMKVVILPGHDERALGGPPTLIEIEQLENRYQLQSEGKSEYYGFDRALSIKRKMDLGFSLKEQLRDDPRYANADERDMANAVKSIETEYLRPLECVDRYLRTFNREQLYSSVSAGPSDKEGRWQAFIDYSMRYERDFKNPKWLLENGVKEDQIGAIEDAAFKMIRLRHLKGLPKIHMVMRDLPKLCAEKESRREVLRISDEVDAHLPKADCTGVTGEHLEAEAIDGKWVARFQEKLIHRVKKAYDLHASAQEKETPLALLDAAWRKLNHEQMTVSTIAIDDLTRAHKLAVDIQRRAHEIEREVFHVEKQTKSLGKKK